MTTLREYSEYCHRSHLFGKQGEGPKKRRTGARLTLERRGQCSIQPLRCDSAHHDHPCPAQSSRWTLFFWMSCLRLLEKIGRVLSREISRVGNAWRLASTSQIVNGQFFSR